MQNYLQSGYVAERVLSASPLELIRMLYEGALSAVDLAVEMFHNNDVMARGRAITKAIDIVGELRASLRDGSEFTATLAELYGYMQDRLQEAHIRKSEDHLLEVSRLLKCLYQGWLGVMRDAAEAQADEEFAAELPILVAANPYELACSPVSARSWQV